jgi:hypothetical protein
VTHKLLVYADEVNILGDYIYTMKKNTETLIVASWVGLEINVQKTKYILLSRHPNVGQNRLKMCHSSNIWGRL